MEYRKLSTATKTRDPLSSGIVIQLLGGALRPTELKIICNSIPRAFRAPSDNSVPRDAKGTTLELNKGLIIKN
jgi:hypothetical protein